MDIRSGNIASCFGFTYVKSDQVPFNVAFDRLCKFKRPVELLDGPLVFGDKSDNGIGAAVEKSNVFFNRPTTVSTSVPGGLVAASGNAEGSKKDVVPCNSMNLAPNPRGIWRPFIDESERETNVPVTVADIFIWTISDGFIYI